MFIEESECVPQNDTATDSLNNHAMEEKENVTFPRRSCVPKSAHKKINFMELLAKATEEDKKANIDVTYPDEDTEETDQENQAPVNLSGTTPTLEPAVLDLSSVKRSSRKGYTEPGYDLKCRSQPLFVRPMPLREVKLIPSQPIKNEVDISAKKSLFNSNQFFYEKEVISQKHISFDAPRKETGLQPMDYKQDPQPIPLKMKETKLEAIREYGHSNTSGFYSQPYSTTSHGPNTAVSQPQQLQNPPHAPRNDVFAVPEPPPKVKSGTKEITVNGNSYQILALLGKGGSSKVHLVLAKDNSLLAIKVVNLATVDERIKRDYLNEIEHLMKMQYCKHIIKIIDHQYIPTRNLLYAVMERGDTDLSRLLKERTNSGEGAPPEIILFYWTEMLLAVKSIHDNNIIHRDLKPANFLLVGGRLKLIDFGIASSIQSEQTSIFKDSQSGTPNYMSPEAWEEMDVGHERVYKIGRKSDVWSLGCILYSFLYGKTPFQEYKNNFAKFRVITDPQHKIPFPKVKGVPDMLIESCRRCLVYNKDIRASIEELLQLKSQTLLTPLEVLKKLRLILEDEAYEKAKTAILQQ